MTAVIVDDEEHCLEVLGHLLHKYCPEIKLLASCSSAEEALPVLKAQSPDILFLDIEMPDMNGFQLLEKFPDPRFAIVFTTAYNEYALKAIKQSALDYLLKPVDKDELIIAVQKAKENKTAKTATGIEHLFEMLSMKRKEKRFAVPTHEGLVMVNSCDIIYCESNSAYCKIFFTGKPLPLVLSKTLKELEEVLTGNDFFRIHHSYLINMQYFQKYIKGEGGEVVMNNGSRLPVSRTRKQDFLNILNRI